MKVDIETFPEILAQYPSRCSQCRGAIRKGEPIKEVIATGKYVHPECVPVREARF